MVDGSSVAHVLTLDVAHAIRAARPTCSLIVS